MQIIAPDTAYVIRSWKTIALRSTISGQAQYFFDADRVVLHPTGSVFEALDLWNQFPPQSNFRVTKLRSPRNLDFA